jgi:hypothetical protein
MNSSINRLALAALLAVLTLVATVAVAEAHGAGTALSQIESR